MIRIPRKTAFPWIQRNTLTDKIGEQGMETCALYRAESMTNFQEEEPVPTVQRIECPVREPIHSQEKQEEERLSMIPTRVEEKMDNTN